MKQWMKSNQENLTIAAVMVVVAIFIIVVLTLPDDNFCSGFNFDYGKCLQQKVDSCMETDAFSRDECVQLVGEPHK